MKEERLIPEQDWYRFYARLDHAIKSPITTLYFCVENLRREPLSPEGLVQLNNLHDQARRLHNLLRGLRGVARLAEIEMEEEQLDIVEVVEWTLDAAREEPAAQEICGGHPLILHWDEGSPDRPAVTGDRDYLLDALYNVIENACKFSPPGAPVDVWVEPEGDWLRIKVVDQGSGIPAEDLPHLGEELYRSRDALATPGIGVGLARVRVILDRHGGYFEVQSKESEGTAVSLMLPLAGRPAREPS
jgi:two-component system OmpR family sensor kinase